MPRIRTIKPSTFRSISLSQVPIAARWLFVGLWTEAEDHGVLRDHAGLIRAAIFPLDDLDVEEVESWLSQLEAVGSICRYEVAGARYLHMPGWHHQRINRPTPESLPGCPRCRAGLAPVVSLAPTALPGLQVLNPRRCPEHQTGSASRCGACKEARIAHDEEIRSRPTHTVTTTMCGLHPEHPARACPECAAEVVPVPADFRSRGRKASS